MGIANKIINVLVLIAAIGAAVCAFLLWQKREQITKGREMLSKAIVQAVDKIGPKGQIKEEDMSIKLEADKLKTPVDLLQKNIAKICKQRDEIAKAFADVVKNVNSLPAFGESKAQVEFAEMTDYDKYGKKRDDGIALVSGRVKYYKERNEIIAEKLRKLSEAMKLAGLFEGEDFLNNDKMSEDFQKQIDHASELVARFQRYSGHIIDAANELQKVVEEGDDLQLNVPASLGLENKDWDRNLTDNMSGIQNLVKKIEALRDAVKKLQQENEELKAKLKEKETLIKAKDAEIASLRDKLEKANAEVKRLKKIIDFGSDDGENSGSALQQSDFSSVKKLIGKITYINPTYGFVVIDLGSKSTIKAKNSDGKEVDKITPLPEGAVMTVATSLDPGDARYVAQIVIARVGTTSSIANVIPLGSSTPKVGDVVFFSESDVREMYEMRKKALEKAETEAGEKAAKAAAAEGEGESASSDEDEDSSDMSGEKSGDGESSSESEESEDEE